MGYIRFHKLVYTCVCESQREMGMEAKLWEVVPFTMMLAIEGSTVGLTIMAKTAISRGMNQFVFVFYTNALSSIILLPYSFIFHMRDRTEQSLFTIPLLTRLFFLGLTGITLAQNLAFTGLSYSSPILVCGMVNLIPALSFLLALILRTTKLNWSCSNSQAKVIGTLISIMGAISITLYKGPLVGRASYSSPNQLQLTSPLLIYSSKPEHWIMGSILLAAASFYVSIWNIIQLGTMEQYPEMMTLVSFCSLIGTIQCGIVSLIAERDLNAWRLKLNMELLLIILSAVFGSIIRISVQIWCSRVKGPLYVPMFKPCGIVVAGVLGTIFFADSLHYGSVVGAFIVGMGYYIVMMGQLRGDETKDEGGIQCEDSSTQKVPLLHNYREACV